MKFLVYATFSFGFSLTATAAQAVPITYTFVTSTVRGTLGPGPFGLPDDGVAFSEPSAIFTLLADTDNVISTPPHNLFEFLVADAGFLQLGNGPEVSILGDLLIVRDTATGLLSLSSSSLQPYFTSSAPSAITLADETTPIASIVNFQGRLDPLDPPLDVSGGRIYFTSDGAVLGTYAARFDPVPSPVPLPAGGALLFGALGLLAMGRRSRCAEKACNRIGRGAC